MNESSLFAEELQDYSLDDVYLSDQDGDNLGLQAKGQDSDSDDGDCQVNVADDVMSLSVISKSINTSYINLKRHNPL